MTEVEKAEKCYHKWKPIVCDEGYYEYKYNECERCGLTWSCDEPYPEPRKREVNLEEHKKELKKEFYIETEISIKQDSYDRLVQIAKKVNKIPQKVIEGLIEDIYNSLKSTGEI
ncbi:MAG: hypothetical protein EU531_10915 [Promethearchaeota archaeon]|nr:MAG: hypothetical protein EU531_10915 [Candidatus Lokiarchaeota archaeon]